MSKEVLTGKSTEGSAGVRQGTSRPIARLVLVAGILLLGAVAASRLPTAYVPSWSFPELIVSLTLPESSDLSDLTRQWILPMESAIRAVGDVRGMAGEVHDQGGSFRVRFRAGSDPQRKAARLESELATLRRRLVGGRLQVWPVGQGAGDRAAIVWLDVAIGEGVDRSLLDALRTLPEVRSVDVAGERKREIRVTPRSGQTVDLDRLGSAIDQRLRVERLGETQIGDVLMPVILGGTRMPAAVVGNTDRRLSGFADLPIRAGRTIVPLGSIATLDVHSETSPVLVHAGGRRGLVLLVAREVDVSPLRFERALRRTLTEFGQAESARFLVNEAEPLGLMLERLAWGLISGMLILGLICGLFAGWRSACWQVLAVPLGLASALNGFWLAGIPLDVTTLPALAIGLGAALFFLALRLSGGRKEALTGAAVVVVAAAVLPVAIALAGGRLGPLLSAPGRAFLTTVAAAVSVLWLLPVPASPALPPAWLNRVFRGVLRQPWAVILSAMTATYLLFVLTGGALEPRAGSLSPTLGDLVIQLRFAQGTTVEQAERQVSAVEAHLNRSEEIMAHWSVFDRRGATMVTQVRPQERELGRLRFMAPRLEFELAGMGASARVIALASGAGGDGEPVRFSEDLESRAETDKESTSYKLVLRHTHLPSLLAAHERLQDRLERIPSDIWRGAMRSDWGRPSARLELVPRPGVSVEEAERVSRSLARRAKLPPSRPLATAEDLALRIMSPDAPLSAEDSPQRHELFSVLSEGGESPRDADRVFTVTEVVTSPTIKRQSGRFVVPMTFAIHGLAEGYRKINRRTAHQAFRELPLPEGTNLELPELNPAIWGRERLRMVAIASALPVLLLALGIIRLSSLSGGLATLIPLTVGVAAVTPFIRGSRGHVDEMTLMGMAMALAGSYPLVLEVAAAARAPRGKSLAGGFLYRWLVQHAPGILGATVAVVCLLVLPGLGLDSDRHPWVLPLRAAAVACAATGLAGCLVLPVLLRSIDQAKTRNRQSERERVRPVAWSENGRSVFEVRNMSKIYGDGFQALHAVDFRLEPGIVGLLGPNGAGKTTLLRLLCGLLEPTRGQVLFRGVALDPLNLPEYRRQVGFLPQGFNAYPEFTGADFLDYWAIERGIVNPRQRRTEVERVLAQVGLEEATDRKVRDFSGGMRRRIGVARALLGEPPILIVDEPTTGLDIESRNRLRETLLAVAGERIILFSTHIASDVAAAASRILVLDRGHLVFDGPANQLIASARGRVFEALLEDHDLRAFSARYRVTTRVRTLEGLRVRAVVYGDQQPAGDVVEPNLEEAYLAMIGTTDRAQGSDIGSPAGSLLDLGVWDSRRG